MGGAERCPAHTRCPRYIWGGLKAKSSKAVPRVSACIGVSVLFRVFPIASALMTAVLCVFSVDVCDAYVCRPLCMAVYHGFLLKQQ